MFRANGNGDSLMTDGNHEQGIARAQAEGHEASKTTNAKEDDVTKLLRKIVKNSEDMSKLASQAIEKLRGERRAVDRRHGRERSILRTRTTVTETLRLLWETLPEDEKKILQQAGYKWQPKKAPEKQ